MNAIGFNQGQFGDLCMNLIACKAHKTKYESSKLTFGINKKYKSIYPIFLKNKLIDDIHIWDGYDDWPTQNDIDFLNQKKFDIIYNPMQRLSEHWQQTHHQTEEICIVHGLIPPKDLQIDLNKYFKTYDYKRYVSICVSGATDSNKKNLPENKIDQVCDLIVKYGYEPLFFQTKHKNYRSINLDFFEAIKIMLSTKMLISIDSAMIWIASGYKFPTIGLYNQNYYSNRGAFTSKNWQPINPNSQYIESESMDATSIFEIEECLKKI